MKLLFVLVFISSMAFSASTYSQKTKIDLQIKNSSLTEIFNSIEKTSEFIFIYNQNIVDFGERRSISVRDKNIEAVLDVLLKDTGIAYKIDDRQVFLFKDDEVRMLPISEIADIAPPQKIEISGKVTDSRGNPIPGATVIIKGTTVGVTSDMDGKFRFDIPLNARILSVSFVGYKTVEIPIGTKVSFSLVLEEMAVDLEEVVAVGFGIQKKVTVTGAVATMKGTELLQSPQANISNSLVGRLPGLLSVQRSGQPGADQTILRIRGIGTFAGSQDPLIMVDGIETDNYNNIDPNEIEGITILKDASATAVYGVRGANGVIIITTKRGIDSKPQVSFSYQHATSQFTDIRNSMNAYDYATCFNEAKKNDGYITGGYTPAFSEEAIEHYKNHDDPIFYPDIDWFAYMFDKNSGQNQYNVNINGGTPNVKYFVSLGYFDQEGLINHTDLIKDYDAQLIYRRYNIRGNFDFHITKHLTANINLSSQIEQRSGSAADIQRVFDACWVSNPVDHPLITDGKYLLLDGMVSSGPSPLSYLFGSGYNKNFRNYLNSSVRFNYDLGFLTRGLSSHATISYNNFNMQDIIYNKNLVAFKPKRTANGSVIFVPQEDPKPFSFSESFGKNRKVYLEVGLDYNRKFGVHNISGLLLYNQSKRHDPNLAYLVPNGYQGLVGRITYDF